MTIVERLAAKDGAGAQRAIRKHLHGPLKGPARHRRHRTGAGATRPLE